MQEGLSSHEGNDEALAFDLGADQQFTGGGSRRH